MDDKSDGNEIRTVFNELQISSFRNEIPLPVPEVVVYGDQTVGKSSILQAFVGFKFNFTTKGFATRRPLMLQCEHDTSIVDPEWTDLETKRVLTTSEVAAVIEKKNSLKEIVSMPMMFRLRASTCWNVSLIDLPGMRANDSDAEPGVRDAIRNIVARYLNENVEGRMILCVESAKVEEFAKSHAFSFLTENCVQWTERTIVVLNMFDLCLESSSVGKSKIEIEKLLDDADSYLNQIQKVRFYTSMPSDKELQSSDSFLSVLEKKENLDRGILGQSNVKPKPYQKVGFSLLARHITDTLAQRYSRSIPNLLSVLVQKQQSLRASIKRCSSLLSTLDEARLISRCTSAANAVVAQFVHLLEGGDSSMYEKYAMTLEEEYAQSGEDERVLSVNELFTPAFRYHRIPLLGGGQYTRLLEEVEVSLRVREVESVDQNLLLNFWMKLKPNSDAHEWRDVVTALVLEQTMKLLEPPIGAAVKRARWLFLRLFEIALDTAVPSTSNDDGSISLPVILSNNDFRSYLKRLFFSFVDQKLVFLKTQLQDYLHACAATVREWRDPMASSASMNAMADISSSTTKDGQRSGGFNSPLPAQTFERVMNFLGRNMNDGAMQPVPEPLRFVDNNFTENNVMKATMHVHMFFGKIRDRFADNIVLLFDAFCKRPLFRELRIDGLELSLSSEEFESMFRPLNEREKVLDEKKRHEDELCLIERHIDRLRRVAAK